jgi:DNA topoisomerase-1
MEKSLVIVESPAKAKTITKFLGKDFKVLACKGHVRALPSKQGSVEIGDDVVPKYDILPDSKKFLAEIAKSLKDCSTVYLATDPDREGEAIAWHLVSALKLDKPVRGKAVPYVVKRIAFHEITKDAIAEAIKTPRDIAVDLVDAQQARVVLDYLVGFNLSPFLWKKVRYGLSAGRVQSVSLRLICDRELEIRAFKQDEYWSIEASLTPQGRQNTFGAQLVQIEGKKLDKFAISNEQEASRILERLSGASYRVASVQKKEIRRTPPPPFITSTLQQEASRKLGFSARKTMSIAQKLYEGIDVGSGTTGLITYMRTDSVNLAESALRNLHDVILKIYGSEFGLKHPRQFAQKSKNAQEAHEAIRPTDACLIPDEIQHALSADEYKLYNLVWKRSMASQMAVALLDSVSIDIDATQQFTFRATGSTVRFPGFMKLYIESDDTAEDEKKEEEGMLPQLDEGQALDLIELRPEQHFTQPPPRFTEATLVKALEELGIGRPSTYASIISILQDREYVQLIKKRFHPEDIGMIVSELLVKHFSKYVDYGFTSYMEDRLDQISRGEASWQPAIKEFWKPFIALIKEKEDEVKKADVTTEKTEETCPECGKPLLIRLGKYGRFYACSGFPDCRYVCNLKNSNGEDAPEAPQLTDELCEQCGKPLVVKQGRYGTFFGCSGYPACKYIRPLKKPVTLDIACPDCGTGKIMEKKSRRGKIFFSCSNYPTCKFATWDKPVAEACPDCGSAYLIEKVSKRYGKVMKCPGESCKYKRTVKTEEAPAQE